MENREWQVVQCCAVSAWQGGKILDSHYTKVLSTKTPFFFFFSEKLSIWPMRGEVGEDIRNIASQAKETGITMI